MRNEITLRKNNRIKAYFAPAGTEYARFYVLSDGEKIGQIQWNGPRQGWGYNESTKGSRGWMIGRGCAWTQAEAIATLEAARERTAEFIREKVVFCAGGAA